LTIWAAADYLLVRIGLSREGPKRFHLDFLLSIITTFRTFETLADAGVVAFAVFNDDIKAEPMPSVTV
jgi:hypothetical protein